VDPVAAAAGSGAAPAVAPAPARAPPSLSLSSGHPKLLTIYATERTPVTGTYMLMGSTSAVATPTAAEPVAVAGPEGAQHGALLRPPPLALSNVSPMLSHHGAATAMPVGGCGYGAPPMVASGVAMSAQLGGVAMSAHPAATSMAGAMVGAMAGASHPAYHLAPAGYAALGTTLVSPLSPLGLVADPTAVPSFGAAAVPSGEPSPLGQGGLSQGGGAAPHSAPPPQPMDQAMGQALQMPMGGHAPPQLLA